MTPFIAPLREAGFRVIAFDAPAHGASGGKVSDPMAFSEAIGAVTEAVGPVRAVIGHSLGAAAALLAAREGVLRPERVVLRRRVSVQESRMNPRHVEKFLSQVVRFRGAVIALVLFAAFMTPRGAVVPLVVVLATVTVTLASMALTEVAYFAITNGMAVALIGIAVADSVHVFSEYYTQMRLHPDASSGQLIVKAMTNIWSAIGITSVTTAAGFLSLYFTTDR